MSWGFLLPDRAGWRVVSGVRAETCGLRLHYHPAGSWPDSFSSDRFSLRRYGSATHRSPQDTHNRVNQINGLQVVESIGSLQELVAKLIVTQRMSGQGMLTGGCGKFLDDHNRPQGATNSRSSIPDAHSMQLLELAIGSALSLFLACESTLKRSATAVPSCQACSVLKHCFSDLLEVVEPLMLEMSEVGWDRRPTKSILKAISVYPGRIANQRSTRMA